MAVETDVVLRPFFEAANGLFGAEWIHKAKWGFPGLTAGKKPYFFRRRMLMSKLTTPF